MTFDLATDQERARLDAQIRAARRFGKLPPGLQLISAPPSWRKRILTLAHRCRHGYTSAATPDPARPKNAYIREDQILPHLPALLPGIESAGRRRRRTRRGVDVSAPVGGPDVIGYLRARQITLIYDPLSKTLRPDTAETPATVIGHAS